MQRLLMKGNEAVAEAAIKAGCRHYFGYPITPQNEIGAYMSKRMPQVDGVFLQAESEIAAINMVMGASAAGARAMTSSSSPGISLKTEGLSYLVGSDLPALVVNVQRGGPGLGTIQPAQSDYNQAVKAAGHGDLRLLVFTPSTVQEMVDYVFEAFDLTEKYLMPGMLLCDGLLGQMMEPVIFPKVEAAPSEKPWALTGHGGKRPPNIVTSLNLDAELCQKANLARFERYAEAEKTQAKAESFMTEDADIIVVAYGACSRIVRSAVITARAKGIKVGLLRPITVWPFPAEQIVAASKNAGALLAVEMSMGQMVHDVRTALEFKKPVHFLGRTGGVVPTPNDVLEQLESIDRGLKA